MKRVIIESPYRADTKLELAANIAYARACVRDSVLRGEAPIASHLLFTQDGILRGDEVAGERKLGIEAGLAWLVVADLMALYVDRGVSEGMREAMVRAQRMSVKVVCRSLDILIMGDADGEGTKQDDENASAPDR